MQKRDHVRSCDACFVSPEHPSGLVASSPKKPSLHMVHV